MKRLLAICLALLLAVGVLPVQTAQAASYQTATVKGGWLRLRSGASFDAQVLGSYYTGTEVTVLGTSGAWYHVRTQSGVNGYMYGAYLTVSTGGTAAGSTAYVTSANGKGVRLRSGPGTTYSVLGLYNVGTQVSIINRGTEWHYVKVGNQTGYMLASCLSNGQNSATVTPAPNYGSGYTAYVTSANGKSVRLRAGNGTEYDVIASYEVGTQVTVLSYGPEWCYIRVGGNAGYMMTEFLTTSQVGNNVTSVTLSTYAPTVGTRLTATVQPAGATVSYQWYNDQGTLLSYASSYTVQASDTGRRLAVQVTGYGSSTGTAKSNYTSVINNAPQTYQLQGVTLNTSTANVGTTLYATVSPSGATASFAWYNDMNSLVGTGSSYTVRSTDAGRRLYCRATGTGNTTGTVSSSYTNQVPSQTTGYQVQSVTLDRTQPRVGDTVTATVYPAGCTVTYAWYNDVGRQLTIGRSYTVQASDVGRKLYCVAIGSGNTTGAATTNYTAAVTGAASTQKLAGTVVIPNGARVGTEITPTLNLNTTYVTYQWYQNGVLISTAPTLYLTSSMLYDDIRLVVQAVNGSGYTGEIGSNYCFVQN